MPIATLYFGRFGRRHCQAAGAQRPKPLWALVALWASLFGSTGLTLSLSAEVVDPASLARQTFESARREYRAHPNDAHASWDFARAAFDLGELATNNSERAEIAQEAITAAKQALTNNPNSAPLHYYLGLNEGELARTKTLGALKLVDLMEHEFTRAIELDPAFDYAGAERSLGLLYRDAPVLASIGSKSKARLHLQRSVDLAPGYPDNRLNLIESELKWGDRKGARRELKLLQDSLPAARKEFTGAAWAASWADWDSRLEKITRTLEEPARLESPHH